MKTIYTGRVTFKQAADRLGNKLKSTVFMCDAKVEGSIPILIMHWPLGP